MNLWGEVLHYVKQKGCSSFRYVHKSPPKSYAFNELSENIKGSSSLQVFHQVLCSFSHEKRNDGNSSKHQLKFKGWNLWCYIKPLSKPFKTSKLPTFKSTSTSPPRFDTKRLQIWRPSRQLPLRSLQLPLVSGWDGLTSCHARKMWHLKPLAVNPLVWSKPPKMQGCWKPTLF